MRPESVDAPDRDRLILSKGHACAGLYAVLAECGFFPLDWLDSFYIDGAKLPGHATADGIPGVEVSTGSLGHGLPIACGMALAAKRDGRPYRVFAVLSDGECDEGSNWEAILFAPQHQLDNLVVIVDYNKIQSLGTRQGRARLGAVCRQVAGVSLGGARSRRPRRRRPERRPRRRCPSSPASRVA